MNHRILAVGALACLSGIALIAFPFANAARPDSDVGHDHQPRHLPLEARSIVIGKVTKWTTNKGGDVDGFHLGDRVIHFPPHLGQEVSTWLNLDDEVTVYAKPKTRPDGSEVMEAVLFQRGQEAMQVPGPKPHPTRPKPAHVGDWDEQLLSVSGKVTEMHENHEGIVDGFKVDAKTEVKFPPHQSESILASVQIGSEVVVDGRRHETPKGDIHLHADRVSSGDALIEIERPEPTGHEDNLRHESDESKKPAGGKGKGKGKGDGHGKPPHVQIVDELRRIRAVLEVQGPR